jgi:hypothetical protein
MSTKADLPAKAMAMLEMDRSAWVAMLGRKRRTVRWSAERRMSQAGPVRDALDAVERQETY